MSDLKIVLQIDAENPTVGDLYLHNGQLRLTETLAEEVAQILFIRFNTFKGEWFLNTDTGVPYFQSILGQKTPLGILNTIFRSIVTNCPGVASLTSFTLNRLTQRRLSVTFIAKLADGTTLSSADFSTFIVGGI